MKMKTEIVAVFSIPTEEEAARGIESEDLLAAYQRRQERNRKFRKIAAVVVALLSLGYWLLQ